jgi:hypothetical protein
MSKSHIVKIGLLERFVNKVRKLQSAGSKHFGNGIPSIIQLPILEQLPLTSFSVGSIPLMEIPTPAALPITGELHLNLSKFRTEQKSVTNKNLTAISPKNLKLTLLSDSTQFDHGGQTKEVEEIKSLLNVLDENGFKVSNMKALPSGVTRITVEDLLGKETTKEPEFVRV